MLSNSVRPVPTLRAPRARFVNGLCLGLAPVVAVLAAALLGAVPAQLAAADGGDGFTPIFDGKSLPASGWDGDPRFWRVEDGAITAESTPENPAKQNTFIIWRQGEVDDFDLRLEFRISSGNSGIQFRSWEEAEKWSVGGYQADIEVGTKSTGSLFGERGGDRLAKALEGTPGSPATPRPGAHRGILAACGERALVGKDHKRHAEGKLGDPEDLLSSFKEKDWNDYRILARGNRIALEVNGRATAEFTDGDPAMARRSGVLALQLHSGRPMKVQFRNIRMKRLKLEGLKKIVFIAGRGSHGSDSHAHNPGCRYLAKCLNDALPDVLACTYRDGWPSDPTALDNADSIIIYCDGGDGHVILPHLEAVGKLMRQGVGLANLHYAVEVPKGKPGDLILEWTGGYFETYWSVNPFWIGKFKKFVEHPITRGVKPFTVEDEWYYHMRFPDGMKDVTAVLTDVPPDETRNGPDGPHSGNPTVRARKGMEEHVGWAIQRPDGGRGFGFTGGHIHWNWGNDGFRTLVLNGIAWTARVEVPPGGVPSKTPTVEELESFLDSPLPADFDRGRVRKLLEAWKAEPAAK